MLQRVPIILNKYKVLLPLLVIILQKSLKNQVNMNTNTIVNGNKLLMGV